MSLTLICAIHDFKLGQEALLVMKVRGVCFNPSVVCVARVVHVALWFW
jgi:hypothetical protein